MFEDAYSRKVVGYEVYEAELGNYAVELLHSDNGAPMKAQTMKAKLEELGVLLS